jgi:alpha-amylase/alpha-mannosidase (GH57 family)
MTTAKKRPRERLSVAILWHQHQPLYRIGFGGEPRGAYLLPWVRLHAVRDYYSMAALVAEFPGIHVTVNLVPSLIAQLEDYLEHGATDQWMELTLKPSHRLTPLERDFIVARFFDAHWKNEIEVHPRYAELLEMRRSGVRFTEQDLTDLKAWFNLAWFPPEARQGAIDLPNGERVSVAGMIEKGSRFGDDDVALVIDEQFKIMRNVIPIHRQLLASGQLEISVAPFYHPILPLLADSDLANVDAKGAVLPRRFHWPLDARAQVEKAALFYRERFGARPRGMWPSEGSVGEHMVGIVADAGYEWMATDRGVLEKSGRNGYETEDPDVLLRPYRAGKPGHNLSVFFRHTRLSDDIGFSMQGYADYDRAAADYTGWIREGFARRVARPGERVLSIILDGENAWGSYRNCGRAFLRGLYKRLSEDPELVTTTFSEFIDGNSDRGIGAHPREEQETVRPLFCASWIDEMGSPHGNDLNIWIGSPEENRAWELLGATREHLEESGATPETHPEAFESMYAAEGSDWFWWLGDDFALAPGSEWTFDWLFRERLKDVYRYLGEVPPRVLDQPIIRQQVVWSDEHPVRAIEPGQILRVMSPGPGTVRWSTNRWKTYDERELAPSGDVMARLAGYAAALGPFDETTWGVEFVLRRGGVDSGPGTYTVLVRKTPRVPTTEGRREVSGKAGRR